MHIVPPCVHVHAASQDVDWAKRLIEQANPVLKSLGYSPSDVAYSSERDPTKVESESSGASLYVLALSPAYESEGLLDAVAKSSVLERASDGRLRVLLVVLTECEWLSWPVRSFPALLDGSPPLDRLDEAELRHAFASFQDIVADAASVPEARKATETRPAPAGKSATPKSAPKREVGSSEVGSNATEDTETPTPGIDAETPGGSELDPDATEVPLSTTPSEGAKGPLDVREVDPGTTEKEKSGTQTGRLDLPLGARGAYNSDKVEDGDALRVRHDVEALSMLVAGYSVEPPLAIGLFGDWGSGKTTFIRKMQEHVAFVTEAARGKTAVKQKDLAFYKHVVQIEFNAWHYVEGNIWASLVEHIFSNLLQQDGVEGKEQHDEIVQKLELKKEALKHAEAKLAALRRQHDLKKARHEKVDSERSTLNSLLNEVVQRIDRLRQQGEALDVGEEVGKALRDVDLQVESKATLHDLADVLERARNIRARARRTMGIARGFRPRAVGVTLASLAVGLVAGGLGAVAIGPMMQGGAVGAGEILSVVVGPLGALAIRARPLLAKADAAVAFLEERVRLAERLTAEALAAEERRQWELKQDIAKTDAQAALAKHEVKGAKKRVEELEHELKNPDPRFLIAEFIQERAKADDYRKHLGLPAIIRRDFARLSDLFKKQREMEENEGEPGYENPPEEKRLTKVNRIVLYIDDLDRCPPERVVDVLQAVHLLLAFPLFVVVIAVDARWVSRSLRSKYKFLLSDVKNGREDAEELDEEDFYTSAKPRDYLEKIFQIPYWLQPMDERGAHALIDEITRESRQAGTPETSRRDEPTGDAIDAAAKAAEEPPKSTPPVVIADVGARPAAPPGEPTKADPPAVPTDPPRDPVDLAPHRMQLDDPEIEYMKRVSAVAGRSPRTLKRFVNCYRLVRLTAHLRERDDERSKAPFDPESSMVILSVVLGMPDVADDVIALLVTLPDSEPVSSFVAKLKTQSRVTDDPLWPELEKVLDGYAEDQGESATVEALKRARRRVARYSFALGVANPTLALHAARERDRIASKRAAGPWRALVPKEPSSEGKAWIRRRAMKWRPNWRGG